MKNTGPGLRERKKLAVMRHVQTTALDLFDRYGYDAVTIERVAEAAEVSPSTVYRHFGTKEHLVLYDDYDPRMIDQLDLLDRATPGTPPLTTVREILDDTIRQMPPGDEVLIRRRMRYAFTVPAVYAGMLQDGEETERILRESFGRQLGLDPEAFELRVFAASVVAAFVAALRYWYEREGELTLIEAVERALDVMEFDLDKPAPGSASRRRA